MSSSGQLSTPRSTVVWFGVTLAAWSTARWATPDLGAATVARPRLDDLVVTASAGALLVCAAWAWLVTTVVLLDAARGRPSPSRVGTAIVPPWTRRVVLALCGVAAIGAAGPGWAGVAPPPAQSVAQAGLSGLPLPDRATDGRTPAPTTADVVVVRAGDSLWSLAARLGGRQDDTSTAARVQELYAANRAVIGPDPDLIHPEQQLRVPPLSRKDKR